MSTELVDQVIPDFETAAAQGLIIKYPENGERQAKAAEFNQNLSYVIDRMRALMISVIQQMQDNQRVFNEQISALSGVVTEVPAAYGTLQQISAELEKDNSTEGAILSAIDTKASIENLDSAVAEMKVLFNAMSNEINKLGA